MVIHHPKLIKTDKALRYSNRTWSFTLAEPSLLYVPNDRVQTQDNRFQCREAHTYKEALKIHEKQIKRSNQMVGGGGEAWKTQKFKYTF